MDSSIIDTICQDLKTNVFAQDIVDHIDPTRASCSRSHQPSTDYRQFKWHDELLFFKNLLNVPNGSPLLRAVQNCHDTYTFGHFGSTKMLDLET